MPLRFTYLSRNNRDGHFIVVSSLNIKMTYSQNYKADELLRLNPFQLASFLVRTRSSMDFADASLGYSSIQVSSRDSASVN